jgi:anti-anti-sigma factor
LELALTTRMIDEVAVVDCGGKIVFQKEALALCELVSELVSRYRSVVVNLENVAAIDGGGLGTLAKCIQGANEAGVRLIFSGVPRKIRNLLDLTQLSSKVDIARNINEALQLSRAAA